MTAVGFEPTPLRTGALSQRLRPLGQTVLLIISNCRILGLAPNGPPGPASEAVEGRSLAPVSVRVAPGVVTSGARGENPNNEPEMEPKSKIKCSGK